MVNIVWPATFILKISISAISLKTKHSLNTNEFGYTLQDQHSLAPPGPLVRSVVDLQPLYTHQGLSSHGQAGAPYTQMDVMWNSIRITQSQEKQLRKRQV